MAWFKLLLILLQMKWFLMQTSVYDEDEMKALADFYSCLGCKRQTAGIEARAAYAHCRMRLLPFHLRLMQAACSKEVLPKLQLKSDIWMEVCRSSSVARRIHQCVRRKENSANLTEEDQRRIKEFKSCAIRVDVQFCQAVPPANFTA